MNNKTLDELTEIIVSLEYNITSVEQEQESLRKEFEYKSNQNNISIANSHKRIEEILIDTNDSIVIEDCSPFDILKNINIYSIISTKNEKINKLMSEYSIGFEDGDIFLSKDFFKNNLDRIINETERYKVSYDNGKYSFNEIGFIIVVKCEDLPEDYFKYTAFLITGEEKKYFTKLVKYSKYGDGWDFNKKSSKEELLTYL